MKKKKLKDVEDIKTNLKAMTWDEIANNLMDLEIELNEVKDNLKKDQRDAFNLLILLYEEEKASRIEKSVNPTKFLEDEQFIAYDWTNDIIDD
jgi:hypothetical protein